jgi:hypothetical protein
MINTFPISASTWIALSANYPYANNVEMINDHICWIDGYNTFKINSFDGCVDVAANRSTIMYLPTSKGLFDFIVDTGLDNVCVGSYCILSIQLGSWFDCERRFMTAVGNDPGTILQVTPLSSSNSFFRFIVNDDGTFSMMQGQGLYVTVSEKTPFDLTMETILSEDDDYRQKFKWYYNNNKIYITTKTDNQAKVGPEYEERFWSFYTTGPYRSNMCACGMRVCNDYHYYSNYYDNPYLFDIEGFDIAYLPKGLVTDHTWVSYYNQFKDKQNNKNTEINNSISGVCLNHLFDLPYHTKINTDNNAMSFNFINLKNIMTGEYEYRVKQGNAQGDIDNTTTTTTTDAACENWTWTSDGNEITLTGYSGPNAVVIPDMLDGLPVTGFGTVFAANTSITSVSGGANITSLGDWAFFSCTALTSISLPAATSISVYAFEYCTALTSVSLPAATSISVGAFEYCSALTSVSLPAVTSIDNSAFISCTALTSVYFAGNAPAEAMDVFSESTNAVIYVTDPTATGWGATWNGRPVVWMPAPTTTSTTLLYLGTGTDAFTQCPDIIYPPIYPPIWRTTTSTTPAPTTTSTTLLYL